MTQSATGLRPRVLTAPSSLPHCPLLTFTVITNTSSVLVECLALNEIVLPLRLRVRGKIEKTTERLAHRAALAAAHLLGLAAGQHLRDLRAMNDPLASLHARLEEAELRARLAWNVAEILTARFAKIPDRNRPYYTPTQRFGILEIKNLLGWSARDTARVFLLCANTVHNWEGCADPNAKTVGVTTKPTPPVRRAADVVRRTVQTMARLGFGGPDMISRVLARAAWRVSARSVRRYAKQRTLPAGPDTRSPRRINHPVVARFVHHTWMMDVSVVRQFLGPDLYMAAVFDAFSRTPLALGTFAHKPTAFQMAHLFKRATRCFATPKYVITDLGKEFAGAFAAMVKRGGVVHRHASKENLYATARLERFWRTLKEAARLHRLTLPLTQKDLHWRLEIALTHYILFRPHEGLRSATPTEAFLGVDPAHADAVEPPRGRPGDAAPLLPFTIECIDASYARFPILKRVA
jgi:hypothetical protein